MDELSSQSASVPDFGRESCLHSSHTPMVECVERRRGSQLTDVSAKLMIYRAFIEEELDVPRYLDRKVHELYSRPEHEDAAPRTMWSLSNAFTSAFKDLDEVPSAGPCMERGASGG